MKLKKLLLIHMKHSQILLEILLFFQMNYSKLKRYIRQCQKRYLENGKNITFYYETKYILDFDIALDIIIGI